MGSQPALIVVINWPSELADEATTGGSRTMYSSISTNESPSKSERLMLARRVGRRFGATSAMIVSLAASEVSAGGFNLDHQNAAALGSAFAGSEATRSEAAFAAYNPAAIGGAGRVNVAASVTGVFPNASYSNADATLLGVANVTGQAASDETTKSAAVPNFSVSFSPIEKLSLGLVVNTPFGLDTQYTDGSIMRYQAQRSALVAVEFTPMVAYEVLPGLVLGGGLRVQYVDLSLTSIIDAGGIAAANGVIGAQPGISDLPASFNGDDTAVGYVFGIQASPHQMIDLGISYSSEIEHDIRGNAHFDIAASPFGQALNAGVGLFAAESFETKLDTPAALALGFRVHLTDRIRLLFSERIMFWSKFDIVTLKFNDGVTPTERLTQNWKDITMTSVGAEFDVIKGTTIRAGYMYDESPIKGDFASPRIPDSDRHWISVGASYLIVDGLTADFGLAYAFFKHRKIHLDGTAPENQFRGSLNAGLDASAIAASLGIRYRF